MSGSHVVVAIYEDNDLLQVEELMQLCLEGENLGRIDHPRRIFAITAKISDKVIGYMVGWTNKMHPYCTYLSIVIHPAYHGLGTETMLLLEIEKLEVKYPLQSSIWETAQFLNMTYKSNGFKEVRRTYMPELDPNDVMPWLEKETPRIEESQDIIMKSLDEVWQTPELMNELIIIVRQVYEETHLVNPMGIHDDASWMNFLLADDLIAEASYIAYDSSDNTIIGYAFLHQSEQPEYVELGWRGCKESKEMGNICGIGNLMKQLTACQIAYAYHQGYTLKAEIDSTDQYQMEILAAFPFKPAPTWITYQKQGTN